MEDKMMMMAMMMITTSPENPTNPSIANQQQPITTSTCPITWKLYENPFYYYSNRPSHHLLLPIFACKISASFWDQTSIRPVMESELDIAKSQITKLKTEIEHERIARKQIESMNKKLNRELSEERRGREALERVCGELAKEVSAARAEINRMRKDMEEERRMLRMAEVLREERVQMKLTDARLLLEEKISELAETKEMQMKNKKDNLMSISFPSNNAADDDIFSVQSVRFVSVESSSTYNVDDDSGIANNSLSIQRRGFSEAENPHIKRGIKGFVEFPKVVKAIKSRSTKLEYKKAQLRILLKQKNPIRSNSLFMSYGLN